VDRNQSCVTGLILGGVPLSAPYDFGLVDPSVLPSVNEGPGHRQRSWDFCEPFAVLILQSQGEAGSSPRFKPRLPFDERPPRSIFFGGSVAKSELLALRRRPTMDVHFGFRDLLFALLQSVDD